MLDARKIPSVGSSPAESLTQARASRLNGKNLPPVERKESVRLTSYLRGTARPAFRAWPEIRGRLHGAKRWAFFLDFDGTLVKLRRRPSEVRMSARAGRVVKLLAAHTGVTVAIVSGRRLRDLRKLVGLERLRYFGLQGAEREGEPAKIGKQATLALEGAKRNAQIQLESIAGIWIEDKGLSFAVHYRGANRAAAARAGAALGRIAAARGDALHVLNGSRVWEVLPAEIPGKSSAVEAVLGELPAETAAVYIGDDGTDEVAFAVLLNEITVRVGRESSTRARYYVRTPADVLRLLARMEKELP
jgi:trehalose 6-phosphate phosphatase